MDLFGLNMPIISALERGLDHSSLRGKVLQNNIANNDTPNFKRSDLNFEVALNQALGGTNGRIPMRETHPGHLQGATLSGASLIYQDNNTAVRNDGNNVDMDAEETKLAENTYTYMYLTRALTSEFNLIRQAYSTQ